jgi:hypothetical protein
MATRLRRSPAHPFRPRQGKKLLRMRLLSGGSSFQWILLRLLRTICVCADTVEAASQGAGPELQSHCDARRRDVQLYSLRVGAPLSLWFASHVAAHLPVCALSFCLSALAHPCFLAGPWTSRTMPSRRLPARSLWARLSECALSHADASFMQLYVQLFTKASSMTCPCEQSCFAPKPEW